MKTANMGYDVNVIQRRCNSCNVNIKSIKQTQTHHITAYRTLSTTMKTGQQQVIPVWQNTAGSKCDYKKLGRGCVKKMSDDQ